MCVCVCECIYTCTIHLYCYWMWIDTLQMHRKYYINKRWGGQHELSRARIACADSQSLSEVQIRCESRRQVIYLRIHAICSGCGDSSRKISICHSVETTQAVFLSSTACEFMVIPKVLLGQVGCDIPLEGQAQLQVPKENQEQCKW